MSEIDPPEMGATGFPKDAFDMTTEGAPSIEELTASCKLLRERLESIHYLAMRDINGYQGSALAEATKEALEVTNYKTALDVIKNEGMDEL